MRERISVWRWGVFSVIASLTLGGCLFAPEVPEEELPPLQPVSWQDVRGWQEDDPTSALEALRESCRVLKKRTEWAAACREASLLGEQDNGTIRQFFEGHFVPYRVTNPDGSASGTITGYYVPELLGSRVPSERFAYPLYAVPDDLLVIDLGGLYPELKRRRLRGRVEGRRVVPYYSRTEIDRGEDPLEGQELFWVEDPVELFFLHIQGSGRIRLEDGSVTMVNYGDQNGHPYRSIGKELIARGEMTLDNMSLQALKAWARSNPDKLWGILGHNPSYIFFRELPAGTESPPGSLGVPLTAGRSLAVDRRYIPLGAPVFLATTWPNSEQPLYRLMVAQDTGGAIKGPVRADFFWGFGPEAGALAGKMKQDGAMWVLLPPGVQVGDRAVAAR